MKKILLLIMWSIPAVLMAQNGVSVKGLEIQSGMVTFEVSWNKSEVPEVWSDSVWVFVDYNNNGVMTRLPLIAGATLTETSAVGVGKVIAVPGNDQGVWVVGNARSAEDGVFSAKVQLPTSVSNIGGACVYASNYPPVGVFENGDGVIFTGTPIYDLVFKDADRKQQNWQVSAGSYSVPTGYTLESFSDKTGAPGKIITHAVYCFPGVIGGGQGESTDLSCASYTPGNIGGEDDALPSCASYVAGAIGGSGDAWPDCATYRAGTIGGVSLATSNCETYVAGLVGGSKDAAPACASYTPGTIGGGDTTPPSCASYTPGNIGGRKDAAPSCASYRAGSIGGVSFAGLPVKS
jgi:hypothetical protein